ncbi:hypothetical protein AURDEDRAFT_162077 [Auricularia subglabra TFB-10046 SS5]|nr:hypothetical protein AURDEDRAFT_162077 [Auricularia subglabra TFB-10046 SS5]
MLEPRLAAWYNAQQARIDALTLNEYLTELANLTLPRNWQNKLRNDILASRMDDDPARKFLDWVVTLQNSNATLQLVGSKLALTDDALKAQIEANVSAELKASLETDPLWASQLDHWIPLVSDRDDYLRAETEKMQALIDAHDARRRASKATRPPLSSRITDPRPALADRITSSSAPTSSAAPRVTLPKLTEAERALLRAHDGCTRCRRFYVSHVNKTCPMAATNSWPSTAPTLTEEIARAAKAAKVKQEPVAAVEYGTEPDTSDSYVNLTTPHLYVNMTVTGPAISEFPIAVRPLLDIGSPSVVIDAALADQLGLRRYRLPPSERNLCSITKEDLGVEEYVKLRLTSGNGSWTSGAVRAKVVKNLCIPIILGMTFLSAERIIIDTYARTAIDARTGYDLLNPVPPRAPESQTAREEPSPLRTLPPPRQSDKAKRPRPARTSMPRFSEPCLAGYLLPAGVMAQVRDRIEVLAFQERLRAEEEAMREKYADCFPTRLPDQVDIPEHIYCTGMTTSSVTRHKGF